MATAPVIAGKRFSPGFAAPHRSGRRALDVYDRGACRAKRLLAHVVVVAAEQQFGLMRPVRARWHDGDHNRSGRAAAGIVGPLHGAPVDAVFAGPRQVMPIRPRRCGNALPAGAAMPETLPHITMIALSAPAGQGLKLWASGTYGHSAPSSPAASVSPRRPIGRPLADRSAHP